MEFELTFPTSKSVDEAIQALEEALSQRKFAVLWQLDVNKTVSNKGLSLDPTVRILEVCSAPKAKQAIETNLSVSSLLPCKIVVRQRDGQTEVALLKPTAVFGLVNDPNLNAFAQEVESGLQEAIKAAI